MLRDLGLLSGFEISNTEHSIEWVLSKRCMATTSWHYCYHWFLWDPRCWPTFRWCWNSAKRHHQGSGVGRLLVTWRVSHKHLRLWEHLCDIAEWFLLQDCVLTLMSRLLWAPQILLTSCSKPRCSVFSPYAPHWSTWSLRQGWCGTQKPCMPTCGTPTQRSHTQQTAPVLLTPGILYSYVCHSFIHSFIQ